MIIRYCLTLASHSPSTYDEIRYDEQHQSGFVILPSRRRLRDYKNYIRPQQGFNAKVINELSCVVKKITNQEKYVVILMDEMKIQEDLVWDKHTGDLIGYMDLGNTELNCATLKKSGEVTSHVLVFFVRSIVNPMKFTLANFGTKNVTALQLFPLFWKTVGIMEDKCKLAVVAVTSDEASSSCHGVVYKTLNTFSDEVRYIYFICDPPQIFSTVME